MTDKQDFLDVELPEDMLLTLEEIARVTYKVRTELGCPLQSELVKAGAIAQLAKVINKRLDNKELREKIGTILWRSGIKSRQEKVKQLLALYPDIEEAIVQARKEQMVLDWAQAGKDLEEAKKQERIREESHTLAQLRYYLGQQPISDLWDDLEGYCQSLEGELQALKGDK